MLRVVEPVLRPVLRSVIGARRNGGSSGPVFPAKPFYFNDFTGIADATTLRSLEGWSAYNSLAATTAHRDKWAVQGGAVARLGGSEDYATAPGKFIVGRSLSSTNHIFRTKMTTKPNDANSLMVVVAGTNENNCVVLTCSSSGGLMQNFIIYKNVNGTLTQLLSQAGVTSPLGRRLQSGDEIELHVLGQFVHLFINGYRITPTGGTSLDTGGAFTKGTICGFGTGQGLGSAFDDVYMAQIGGVTTMADTPIYWPGSLSLGGRSVPLSGTYSGDVQALDYRVINDSTGAVVKDWARLSDATVAAGSWSANAFVPMCSLSVNPKVRVQVRAANDVDVRALSGTTAVGFTPGSYGQSNSFYRSQGSATSHAVANAYTFGQDNGGIWQGGATTTVTRSQLWASKMAEQMGVPVGIFIGGSGSKTVVELSTRGGGNNVLDEMEALCQSANAYGYIGAWLWTQGEAEASGALPFDETAYRNQFDILLSELRGAIAADSSAPVGVCVIGRTSGGHISGPTFGDANWSATRSGLSRLDDKPGVYLSNGLFDATLIDSLHYTADSYVEDGRRAALSMRKALGYGGYDGRGPLITGASRLGAIVTLTVDLNGATSISGTGLTDYQVSVDNFVTLSTVSIAAVSGGNIVLTLASDPGLPVKVRSFYGMNWSAPSLVVGNYADGTTIPVEPIYTAITAT